MMSRPSPSRLPVRPGPTGVADVAVALRRLFAGDTDPVAIGPAMDSTQPSHHHAAALAAALREDAPIDRPDATLVVATSGSTGEPQGVLLSTQALATAADLGSSALGAPGVWLAAVPVSGIGGILTVARSIRAGHDPIALPGVGGAAPFTAAEFTEFAVETLRKADGLGVPAYLSLVPTQLRRLVLAGPQALEVLARFGAVLVGGAATRFEDRQQAISAGVNLVTTYGATETAGGVIYDGQPLPGVGLHFLDQTTGARTESGPGQIVVSGPTLALGYRLRPDLTEKAFGPDGYHSPDLGQCQSGTLTVSGRLDQVVKVGGVKVALGAVSEALRSHPRVIDAVTVTQDDPEWGVVPISYVVTDATDEGADELLDELGAAVIDRLGRASQPRRINLVAQLPTSHSGKPQAPKGP